MSKKEKKPGFMKRLFSSKKLLDDDEDVKKNDKKLTRMNTCDPASFEKRTEDDVVASAMKEKSKEAPAAMVKKPAPKVPPKVPPKQPAAAAHSKKKGKKRKDPAKKDEFVNVNTDKPLEFPTTPEQVIAYHKIKPFLSHSEEWLIVELNEFECLLESRDIIKIIAKHSKFFEVEPDELWEEFFEFMEEVPSYDEVINYDVWQEFRDKKYPM